MQLARTIQHVIGVFSNRDSKEKVSRKFYNVYAIVGEGVPRDLKSHYIKECIE